MLFRSLPREVPRVATPADYAGMREIVRAVQGRSSPLAVLAGVPMLLAMEREASKWEEGSVEQGRERAQACREIVATGLVAVGTTWGVPDLVQLGEQVRLTPSSLLQRRADLLVHVSGPVVSRTLCPAGLVQVQSI